MKTKTKKLKIGIVIALILVVGYFIYKAAHVLHENWIISGENWEINCYEGEDCAAELWYELFHSNLPTQEDIDEAIETMGDDYLYYLHTDDRGRTVWIYRMAEISPLGSHYTQHNWYFIDSEGFVRFNYILLIRLCRHELIQWWLI